MIELRHLDKKFNKNSSNKIHVINDISLTFPEKGLVVLLGPSGSGKTTLLNVVGGLDKADKGSINFYGKEINKYKANVWDKLRVEDVGYIFQNYYLMNELSVFDNVAFVLKLIGITDKEAIETRVNYILTQVGMFKYRKKRASQLSGGQQQRVAIARALVKNPKVIIADEPTGNLDSVNTLDVMNIIKTISLNKLVILVTHERELADFYADRIIELKDGQIISDNINENDNDHAFQADNAVYLKDMHKVSSLNKNGLKAELYSDTDEEVATTVRLIIKNKTLYIDVDSPITKVKLNNDAIKLKIVDDHYKKKTKKELLETSFDDSILNNDGVAKDKKLVVSTKNSFWIAFRKFINYKAKGKILLLLFMLAGVLFAFSFTSLYTNLTRSTDAYIQFDENTIVLDLFQQNINDPDQFYNAIKEASNNDFYVTSIAESSLNLYLNGNTSTNLSNQYTINHKSTFDQSKLLYGRLIENDNEIILSKAVYSLTNQEITPLTSVGIWSLNQLLGETVMMNNYELKVVGISSSLHSVVYVNDYKIMVNKYQQDDTITEEEYKLMINRANSRVMSNGYPYIVKNTQEVKNRLEENNFTSSSALANAITSKNNAIARELATQLPSLLIISLGSLIAFFFVMRSSMISRIYEIAVYRALGVRKTEIYSSFAIEIVLLTIISSFIGYLGLSFVLYSIGKTPVSGFINYKVDFISISGGLIVLLVLNLLVGLLPMISLLRKTPSQIISTYDM